MTTLLTGAENTPCDDYAPCMVNPLSHERFDNPHLEHVLLTPGPTPIHPAGQAALMRSIA